MKSKALLEKPISLIVPPLEEGVKKKLPKYCPKPNPNNLATQYYFLNLKLQKENQNLRKENQKLKQENQDLKRQIKNLKEKVKDLIIEKQNFLKMIFKPKRETRKRISTTTIELLKNQEQNKAIVVPFQIK